MKTIFYFLHTSRYITLILFAFLQFLTFRSQSQICETPATVIYGLTADGAIYPISVGTATVGAAIKTASYSGNSPSSSNGLAYNSTNGKFYYFKRNIGTSPEEFVSYDPGLALVTVLASSTCAATVHTGSITANGKAYYTIDVNGNFNYYDIINNKWTFISSDFKDQYGANVTSVIQSQSAGDLAFDGNGNLWIITSNSSNYGLYKLSAPMPTSTTAATQMVTRIISPSTPTPNGNMIAGIAFNPTGQIFLATKNDERLYRLENNLTTTYLGTFSVADVGNDLTSCAFPLGVLPVSWVNYNATLINNNRVYLEWTAIEQDPTGYSVQYSKDGIIWKELTHIQSSNRGGSAHQYTFTHYTPSKDENYYRIKMTDAANKESFSVTKLINLKSPTSGITVWPNPARDYIRISGQLENSDSPVSVKVFDLAGKMQMEGQLKPGESTFNISALKSGTYLINLYSIDGTRGNQKFIKL